KAWPNPYFGFNPEERNPVDHQMHFTHLPESGSCVIRIFDLAGVPVRRIKHDDGTQYEVWDLTNNYGIPVASGMYIVHVETDEGDQVLKVAVILPEQRLDVY
ncbi:MAG: T9SS type A sorting domain-containing protein, partial [Candidatus Marinimicrobia bacterium]|nr:T9SS type A sorting domain-containing protein [Candidatus Neomarinimicrobiota bacterium]